MAERTARVPELTEDQAVAQFEKAVKEHSDATSHFNLGSAYYAAHNLDAAFKEFQEAAALQPGLDHAHYYLGVIFKTRSDKDKARAEFNQVINGGANMMLKSQANIQLKSLDSK
jgi:tetratricopeptide (TPR) repeat protein